jgi:SSS family transporter
MAAVIWTDVVQLSIYATGAVIAALSIAHHVPGGWETIHAVASQADKFRVFDFSWSPSATYTLWSGVLGGALLTTASHGTDQLIVQRLLAARNRRDASLALLASGVVVFALFTLFLLIGAMLYVYYSMAPPAAAFTRSDMVFPTYVVTRMPHGISGLLISAILAAAMSNLSAALNAMASTTTIDFYGRFFPRTTEERRVTVSRRFTIGWAVLLFALAIAARHGGRVLEMGLSIASVAYGGLLGVFLLGVLTKTAIESGAMIGMVTGFALNVYLWLFTNVAFTWYVALGSGMTFIVGLAASFLLDGGSDAGLRAGLRQSGEA